MGLKLYYLQREQGTERTAKFGESKRERSLMFVQPNEGKLDEELTSPMEKTSTLEYQQQTAKSRSQHSE